MTLQFKTYIFKPMNPETSTRKVYWTFKQVYINNSHEVFSFRALVPVLNSHVRTQNFRSHMQLFHTGNIPMWAG
jgi:hypothetical protein